MPVTTSVFLQQRLWWKLFFRPFLSVFPAKGRYINKWKDILFGNERKYRAVSVRANGRRFVTGRCPFEENFRIIPYQILRTINIYSLGKLVVLIVLGLPRVFAKVRTMLRVHIISRFYENIYIIDENVFLYLWYFQIWFWIYTAFILQIQSCTK